ncbi:hypothetical protein GJ496_011971 [Pomphorhynchus laevis]|nr:hypothetical protein GJ496_011971 [Pomphorhynchus laevis]
MRDKQISTRGLGQALVRRRVSLLHQILEEYEIDAAIEKIESAQNKAYVLSRIPKAWIKSTACCLASCDERLRTLRTHSENHHQGVERTLYLANRVFPDHKFRRSKSVEIIISCDRCLRIDPSSICWEVYLKVSPCSPADQIYSYEFRLPVSVKQHESNTVVHDFSHGDAVYVRPPGSRCFTEWPMQVFIRSGNGLSDEVAGIPRHIADVRKATDCKNHSSMSISNANNYN